MKFSFIENHRSSFSVEKMCRHLEVSKSGYYGWFNRLISKRGVENNRILEEIKMIRTNKKKQTYGYPRMTEELKEKGFVCGIKRVANIMKKAGIQAKTKRKWKATTNSNHNLPVAPDLVKQDFQTSAPYKLWTSDITYIWTAAGWLYLAIILDVFNRKIVGWAMNKRMTQDLVLSALSQACNRYNPPKGIIFHSDRGSQYAAKKVRSFLKSKGFIQSMSRKGNCYDNAITETFFKTIKTE